MMQRAADDCVEHRRLLVDVPFGGARGQEGAAPDRARPPRHEPLAGPQAVDERLGRRGERATRTSRRAKVSPPELHVGDRHARVVEERDQAAPRSPASRRAGRSRPRRRCRWAARRCCGRPAGSRSRTPCAGPPQVSARRAAARGRGPRGALSVRGAGGRALRAPPGPGPRPRGAARPRSRGGAPSRRARGRLPPRPSAPGRRRPRPRGPTRGPERRRPRRPRRGRPRSRPPPGPPAPRRAAPRGRAARPGPAPPRPRSWPRPSAAP